MMTFPECHCCSGNEVHALLTTFNFSAYTSGVASEHGRLAELQNTQYSREAVSFFCGNCPRLERGKLCIFHGLYVNAGY